MKLRYPVLAIVGIGLLIGVAGYYYHSDTPFEPNIIVLDNDTPLKPPVPKDQTITVTKEVDNLKGEAKSSEVGIKKDEPEVKEVPPVVVVPAPKPVQVQPPVVVQSPPPSPPPVVMPVPKVIAPLPPETKDGGKTLVTPTPAPTITPMPPKAKAAAPKKPRREVRDVIDGIECVWRDPDILRGLPKRE